MGHFCNMQSDAEEQQLGGRGESAKEMSPPPFRSKGTAGTLHPHQKLCMLPCSVPTSWMLMACFQSMTRIHFPQSLILEPKGLEATPDSTDDRPAEPPGFLPSPRVLPELMGRAEMT